jgi:hypothetical protein
MNLKLQLTGGPTFRANVGDFRRVRRGKLISDVDAPVMLGPEVTLSALFRVTTCPVNRFANRGQKCFGCAVKKLVISFAPIR